MKKFFVVFVFLTFVVSIVSGPVFAAGGKNQGSVGSGSVDQGDTADAPGSDAQDTIILLLPQIVTGYIDCTFSLYTADHLSN